jgi:penicillin amidase
VSARSNTDLFFAQGYVHAQDRLWQMDLNRRMARGLLAEAFGERALDVDRFYRRLGFQRVAEEDLARMRAEQRDALDAYAGGVNAYLEHARRRLPLEFVLARSEPRPWSALDCLALGHLVGWLLTYNWDSEVWRERFITCLGPDAAAALEPGVPPDLFQPLTPQPPASAPMAPAIGLEEGGITPASSNAWAVSGQRSITGRPLLACDPHLTLHAPPTWHEAHLSGGDYHVAGASIAGLPGVIIGHNERIAWGVTLAILDVQDLFVMRMDPGDPRRYAYDGVWVQGELVRETIPVRGRTGPAIEDVLLTRHGPIITPTSILPGETRALALRSTALLPWPLPGGSLLPLNRAGSWEEFRAALSAWDVPTLNFVYADVDGNVGFQMAGRVPVRKSGAALVPRPGWTGEHDWDGWVPFDDLPTTFNPPEGFVASANNAPEATGEVQAGPYLSWEWAAPYRYQRICQVLRSRPRHSLRDFRDLQMDTRCLPGLEVATYLSRLPLPSPAPVLVTWAARELAAWDGSMGEHSVGASLYGAFRAAFCQRRFGAALGEQLRGLLGHGHHPLVNPTSSYYMRLSQVPVELLRARGDDPSVRQDAYAALCDALAYLEARLGPDPRQWHWGSVHRVTIHHSLSSRKPLNRLFDLGPYPIGGDADTPLKAAAIPPDLDVNASAASYRLLCDVSDWDNSVAILPGGQSGQRTSQHYADQLPLWQKGQYHPMPFTPDAVLSHTHAMLTLLPSR